MENNDSESFRVSFDDDESIRPIRQEEAGGNLPPGKLNQRLTIILILIPCLIAVIITIAYINLNKKISDIQNSGSIKVQSLSTDLEKKLTDLSEKTDQLKALIENQSKQFEKKLSSVSVNLGQNKKSLKKSVEVKASKKDLNKYVTKINGQIEGLKKDISKFSSDIQALDSNLNGKIEKELKGFPEALDGMTKDVNKLKQGMSQLSDAGIDQKKLDYELNLQGKKYRTELRQAKADLEKKISSLRKKVERQTAARKDSIKSTKDSLKLPLPKPNASLKPLADALKENEIIEQDISE